MRYANYSLVVVLMLFLIVLASAPANAGIGQTAGELNFGEVPRGGQKTLTFNVINTDPTPMPIAAEVLGNMTGITTVEPKTTVIPVGGQVTLYVTIYMPRDAEIGTPYVGSVLVKSDYGAAPGGGVGVSFVLGIRKDATAVAGGEIKPPGPESQVLLLVLAIIVAVILLVFALGIFKRKRRK